MNDTPRTDAIAHRGYNESAYISEMTGLSRQLERENQTFRAAQKACEDCDAPRVDRIAELERELQETRSDLEFRRGLYKLQSERVERLERELEQEHQDRKQAEADVCRALGERNDARKELEQIKAVLADPVAVHLNMMRGTIAWTPANLRHLLGDTGDARAELASLRATLEDPDEVELAMIRGEIAIPDRAEFDAIRETPVGYNPSPTDP